MNIGIYIYEGAEVLDFSGAFQVFSTASRICATGSIFTVFLVGETDAMIHARGGYQVLPNYSFENHPPLDVLIVVGGAHAAEMEKPAVLAWIRHQASRAALVASICTGAFLLAKAGVVRSENVTTHWEDIQDLQSRFPALRVCAGVRFVDDGHIVTSAGIAAGIDMSLHLVERLQSFELAARTAYKMDFDWTRDGVEARADDEE